jgi:hypothetical protein
MVPDLTLLPPLAHGQETELPFACYPPIAATGRVNARSPLDLATCEEVAMPAYKDITGQRFGKLMALEVIGRANGQALWKCVCDCGKISTAYGANLRKGTTTSCGCRRKEPPHNKRHGERRPETPEYKCWHSMRERCLNPKHPFFKDYGGRGITICERWNSYENFLDDMGRRPPDHVFDRTDNDGNYEPSNCRWVTVTESNQNRRSSKRNNSGRFTKR